MSFTSFFIMGITLAGFSMAFHITCYISDGHRFSFIGSVRRPFNKFSINNSLIPIFFMSVFIYQTIGFQINNEFTTRKELLTHMAGLFAGYAVMTAIFSLYFRFTNQDIFKYMVCRIDKKLKQNVRMTRASALHKLDTARRKQIRVDYYLDAD